MTYEIIHSHAEIVKELEKECRLKIDEVRMKANAEIAKIKNAFKDKIKDANSTLNTALRGQNV
jgi:F0F1-type ATP synthase membrane subunit b/b'